MTILFFVTILSDLYSHETDHCVLWTGSSKKRERLLVVYMFAVFTSGARTVKMFYFARLR